MNLNVDQRYQCYESEYFFFFDEILVRIILGKYIQKYEHDLFGTEIEQIKHKLMHIHFDAARMPKTF